MAPSVLERRQIRATGARRLPWTIGGLLLIVTLVVSLISRQNVRDEQDAALAASTSLFENTVAETRTRLDLEQSKLMFLLKGVASWARTNADLEAAALGDYMASLPVEEKLPALGVVTLLQRDVGGSRFVSPTSPTGEPMTTLAGDTAAPPLDVALDHADVDDMIRMATGADLDGSFVWLFVEVPDRAGWFVGARFVGEVFLSPALGAGGTIASLSPASGDFVVTPPGSQPWVTDRPADGSIGLTSDDSMFTYASEVSVFGSSWRLDVVSSEEFLEIPQSREYLLWLLGGVLVSLAAVVIVFMRQRDVRRQLGASEALTRSSRRFTTGFDNAPIGMAEIDSLGTVVRANETMKLQLGRDDLVGVRLPDLVDDADSEAYEQHRRRLDRGVASSAQLDLRYGRPDGSETWVTESISALDRSDDPDRHFLVQQLDTTDRHRIERELHEQAYTDSLTGLPNRAALVAALEQDLVDSRRTGRPIALFFVDLDRFKVVNDSLGHSAGDDVLRIVAQRLVDEVPDLHMVGRFGGDEFVIVCPDIEEPELIGPFADVLLGAVRAPIQLADAPVQITASVGFTFSAEHDTAETLLRDADAAMYKAKARGRNVVQRFASPIRREAVERLDLERALQRALDADEFEVWYQPMVDLTTDRVVGIEALLRWRHPERGLLEPAQFLGVASEVGLLDEIDRRTLRSSWAQLDRWSATNSAAREWHLAVNCSPKWFMDGRLRTLLPRVLNDSSLDPARLWLEVTESDLLADGAHARAELDALHELGVKVAIDDFGTGFSSLSYLSRFEIDRLKIDRSFVSSLGESSADEAIVSAVVEMAAALGIPTVAEGTENQRQLDTVRRLGADYAQGYLLSRPRSADDVERALLTLS